MTLSSLIAAQSGFATTAQGAKADTALQTQTQVDWTQATSTHPAFIKNKPTLGTASAQNTSAFDAAGAATAAQAAAIQRANHTGTQSADTIVDGSTNKSYTATEKTKLAAIDAAATAFTTDTGWTAATATGDKAVTLADYTNGINGTMVTALNVTSAGLGTTLSAALDQISILTKELAALRAAFKAKKIPNA